jgi:hypothetical protein
LDGLHICLEFLAVIVISAKYFVTVWLDDDTAESPGDPIYWEDDELEFGDVDLAA